MERSFKIFSVYQLTWLLYIDGYLYPHRHSGQYKITVILSKHFSIVPTVAHNYKIIGMFKIMKIPTIAPTCLGSRRNHYQGTISCLAKTTIMTLLCSSLMTWSMLWRHTSLLCKRAVSRACTAG
jgi:hypothetical protein